MDQLLWFNPMVLCKQQAWNAENPKDTVEVTTAGEEARLHLKHPTRMKVVKEDERGL